jgi:hypothetical protein
MDYTDKQLAELFKQAKNIIPATCNGARAGETITFRSSMLNQPQKALCLNDVKSGECTAIQSNLGNWFLLSSAENTNKVSLQNISNYYQINSRKKKTCRIEEEKLLLIDSNILKKFTYKGNVKIYSFSTRKSNNCDIIIKLKDFKSFKHLCFAYLYWVTIGSITDSHGEIFINGKKTVGKLIAKSGDTCWGATGNYTFFADVSKLVTVPSTLSITGLNPIEPRTKEGQGIVLVLLYNGNKKIDIYHGGISNSGGTTALAFNQEKIKKITVAIADCQGYFTNVTLNNTLIINQYKLGVAQEVVTNEILSKVLEEKMLASTLRIKNSTDCLYTYLAILEDKA